MSSYLDFGSTKKFRDNLISRTLNVPNGPQTFTDSNYQVKNFDIKNNVERKDVVFNRENDLSNIRKFNTYKPEEFYIIEEIKTLPQARNLQLYPYFNSTKYSLFGMTNIQDYEKESELLKFASQHIKNERQGPLFSRIEQNHFLYNGDSDSISYKITPFTQDKEKNFIDIVEGKTLPWDRMEGEYLSNPLKPIINRPTKSTEAGKIIQDITGKVGEMFGINRRENRNPSDLFVENMGEGQKQLLFFNISFSKYGPNYTDTARTKNSSSLFGFVDDVLDGKMGDDAPYNYSYIGDDRSNNVKNSLTDNVGNHVRSSYYLSLLFDPVQTELFNRSEAISNGGSIGGQLTWISSKSKNKLGLHNKSWSSQSSQFDQGLSTDFDFREGSIMGLTQELLNSLPNDGLASRSHVANVIDQTSRMFKDGGKIMSRGSAVKYVNKEGEDVGAEYCRVWTKDRPYFTYGDTMKRQGNIRNFDGSIMGGGSKPWNLNVAPMSDGNKSFDDSTNIKKIGDGSFIAQKYMLSIENLAWKTSNLPGFTYNDLPFSERGPNGGRVMWFPPYGIMINDQSSASWDPNTFLGRPEPIYTYKGTERSGTLTFKVIVDHPSILNLLVREHFKDMSDKDADEYIDAFFSGCEELDFYDLIRRYSTLDANDIELITQYLNEKADREVIKKYKLGVIPPNPPETILEPQPTVKTFADTQLMFPNDFPVGKDVSTDSDYDTIYNSSLGNEDYKDKTKNLFLDAMVSIMNTNTTKNIQDRVELFGKSNLTIDEFISQRTIKLGELDKFIVEGISSYKSLEDNLEIIKNDIKNKAVQEITIIVESGCSAAADITHNYKLSLRRTHAIIKKIFGYLKGDNTYQDKWTNIPKATPNSIAEVRREYLFKDLGFEDIEGKINLISRSAGEKVQLNEKYNCTTTNYHDVNLKKHSPVAFGCRQSTVKITYDKAVIQQASQEPKLTDTETPRTMLLPDGETVIEKNNKKPNIDVMKRIIMKTLSEGFYFKKLEETDPHIYSSLREKLKYFHPSFHSMTPEGLNSRLTFLNQCLRPGDTIPIKGYSDNNDLMARNTTFGPPPISILRVGDFYNSKVIFENLTISFEDTTWDLNPEGIGMQPMLASVTLQLKFLGGQGLEKPVERLQNALSSNFYANTEMYDERAMGTNSSIGGRKTEEFTKEFLEDLYNNYTPVADSKMMNNESSQLIKGVHIGEGTNPISYKTLVKEFDEGVVNYYTEYEKLYNDIQKKYGKEIAIYLLTNTYREINTFDLNGVDVELLGVPTYENRFNDRLDRLKDVMVETMLSSSPSEFIKYGSSLNKTKKELVDESLVKQIIELVKSKFDSIKTDTNILNFEKNRNNIIRTMDKINFLLTKEYDCIIEGENYKKTNLEQFNVSDINNAIEPTIDMIIKNNKKINKIITNNIDFNNIIIDNDLLSENLSLLIDEENLVFNDNSFTQSERDIVNKAIKKFINNKKEHKFNFDLKPNSNKKELSFNVIDEEVLTDDGIKKEIFIIFKDKMNNKTEKLNYYRKNV